MSHPVIPPPVRFEGDAAQFALRPGTTIACTATGLAPIVERFCAEIRRRTGLPIGHPGPGEPDVRIELAPGDAMLRPPQGLSPTGGTPVDERYSLTAAGGHIVLRAAEPAGVARGLTTLLQLATATPYRGAGAGARIVDAPRYAWRGLSLDVARRFLTPGEVRRVIDLLALYKLNVLHLHLTDDQGWRLPAGTNGACYTPEDLRALIAYAADRFVSVVPEVDMPGHVTAFLRMHPELSTGRNEGDHATWLDPALPATFPLVEGVLADVAELFPSPYLHIGGDEPWGMPHDLYVSFVRRVRDHVRSLGKRPLAWQESARAGLETTDIVQYWLTGIALAPSLPAEVLARQDADLALARRDIEAAVAASIPVIVSPQSHCYLDAAYAEPSADAAQADRQARVGQRLYAPMTVAQSFGWEPADLLGPGRAAHVAGVEAAIWTETVADFGDLTFQLLPRLPGVAHKAWSDPRAGAWADHRDRLAWHGRLWAQDDLTYFRTSMVNWRLPIWPGPPAASAPARWR
jgi:hexosaminidase